MKIRVIRLPILLPTWAEAQVLLPRTIFVRGETVLSTALLAHELCHVGQIEKKGLLRYWLTYLSGLARLGYDSHPMEVEARQAEHSTLHRAAAATIINKIGVHGSGTVTVPPF